ncbi:MAG: MTH938/NDUFAF3 family protein [Candidatus Edwardsbacteria bacterium]|jgi:hypothetical protein|nr:MTH938/NDUFAF3 family protein [Candidatus Edwardsbacteria bacterium]
MIIDACSFGRITVDGRDYTADVIISSGRVDDSWWREQGHHCRLADLAAALAAPPAVLIVGTGDPGLMRVDEDLKVFCAANGVELLVLPTAQAADEYNRRQRAGVPVVAALHLTC